MSIYGGKGRGREGKGREREGIFGDEEMGPTKQAKKSLEMRKGDLFYGVSFLLSPPCEGWWDE